MAYRLNPGRTAENPEIVIVGCGGRNPGRTPARTPQALLRRHLRLTTNREVKDSW